MKLYLLSGLVALLLINSSFQQPVIPAALQGKWNIRVTRSKLIGSIDIKPDGKYNYYVTPGYRESGKITLNQRANPAEINLIVNRSRGVEDITKGIYRIVNGQLNLCIGKKNGTRPRSFESNQQANIILWIGSK
jgi:uncharacterized protein (TIGR03067 family)